MKKRVRRFDLSRLDKIEEMPQGYLRAPANATRVGIFVYKNADGSKRRELRLPEEVFKEDSLVTLAGVPLVNNHPPEQLLNLENTKKYLVGYTGTEVNHDDKFLKTTVTVVDPNTIEDVKLGKIELSCGYECNLDEKPGVWEGQPYDCIQKDIRYNHLALVNKGRAGDEVRLRTDSSDAVMVSDELKENQMGMKKMLVNGLEHDVPEEVANAHAALQQEHKVLNDKYAALLKEHASKPAEEDDDDDDDAVKPGEGGQADPKGQAAAASSEAKTMPDDDDDDDDDDKAADDCSPKDASEYDDAKASGGATGQSGINTQEAHAAGGKGKVGAASKGAESPEESKDIGKPQGEAKGVPATLEELAAKVDALTDENAKLKQARKDSLDPKTLREAVKSRLHIEKIAERVALDEETKARMDDMDDMDLKKAVIKAECPNTDLSNKSDVYMAARFDMIAEQLEEKDAELEHVGKVLGICATDGKDPKDAAKEAKSDADDAEAARQRMIQNESEAWKKPTGHTRKEKK